MLYILSATLHFGICVYACSFGINYSGRLIVQQTQDWLTITNLVVVVVSGLSFLICFIFVLVLVVTHMYLIRRGMTTNEFLKRQGFSKLAKEEERYFHEFIFTQF